MLINVISDTKWHTDVNVIQRIWVTKNLRLHNKCQSDTLKLMLYMECQWHRNNCYLLNVIVTHLS